MIQEMFSKNKIEYPKHQAGSADWFLGYINK